MKNYTTCFVGIPLPLQFQEEFESLLNEIKNIDLSFETVYPFTPHITLYYLSKQSQENIEEISKKIKEITKDFSKKNEIHLGGLGYFNKDNPRVIFLEVNSTEILIKLNQVLAENLQKYSAKDNGNPFHPHLTIAGINFSLKNSFFENEEKIKNIFQKINWNFKLSEIAVYGVDSSKFPEHQEKLITFSV